jgi:hypothetical protein
LPIISGAQRLEDTSRRIQTWRKNALMSAFIPRPSSGLTNTACYQSFF